MVRHLAIMSLAALSAGCLWNPAPLRMDCVLDFAAVDEGFIDVLVSFPGRLPTELVGRSRMDLSDLQSVAADGSITFLEAEVGDQAVAASLPSYTKTLKYRVRPGAVWERKSVGEDLGIRFGFLSRTFSILDGSGLFLIPRNYADLGEVTIRIKNRPPSVSLFTTMRERDGVFRPDPSSGGNSASRLHQSIIAMGDFQRDSIDFAEMTLEIVSERGLNSRVGAEQRQWIKSLFRRLCQESETDGSPSHSYRILLFPYAPSGHAIHVASSRVAQGLSVGAWTPFVRHEIAYNLANALLRDNPGGLNYAAESLWLAEGLAQYLALRLGNEPQDFKAGIKRAYDQYFIDPRLTFSDLSAPAALVDLEPPRHWAKALLMTHWIQTQLSAKGRDIFDLIRRFRREGNRVDLKPVLSALVDRDFAQRIAAFVKEKDRILPPDILPQRPPVLAFRPEDERKPAQIEDGGKELPRSKYRIAFTSNTFGFLENCGCKGNDWGGVTRRKTALSLLRKSADHCLSLDAGDYFPAERRSPFLNGQTVRELATSLRAMRLMKLDAVGIGLSEIRYSPTFFHSTVDGFDLPLVTSNILDLRGAPIALPYVQRKFGPYRALIVGAWQYKEPPSKLNRYFQDALNDLRIADPADSVAQAAKAAKATPRDLVIVLGNIGPDAAQRIIDRVPLVDLIVTGERYRIDYQAIPSRADDDETFRLVREHFPARYKSAAILFAISDGYAISFADLDLRDGMVASVRVSTLPLSEEVDDDPQVARLVSDFYAAEKKAGDIHSPQRPQVSSHAGNTLVGAQACRDCHASQFEQWRETKHAVAFKELITRRRNRVPLCVACHVTGYSETPGFRDGRDEKAFGGVQCEMCHGAGSEHVRSPIEAPLQTVPGPDTCLECHTPDHSKSFSYSQRLERIRHIGSNARALGSTAGRRN